jgi:hypothetical protein
MSENIQLTSKDILSVYLFLDIYGQDLLDQAEIRRILKKLWWEL